MNNSLRPFLLATAFAVVPLFGQEVGPILHPPAPQPEPFDATKGPHDPSPMTEEEFQRILRERRPPQDRGALAERAKGEPSTLFTQVLYDEPGDGRIWAAGATYKASFGAEGFVYVPNFGTLAPQNYPLHLVVREVRVGGRPLAFTASAQAARTADGVAFDRGALQEVYHLTPRAAEQTFVVTSELPGDVEVELEVRSELTERGDLPGLQFGNQFGLVDYGTAYVVTAAGKTAIETTYGARGLCIKVPAALRDGDRVVIDPMLSSVTNNLFGVHNSDHPDIAYDASTDTFIVVWEFLFSASDTDIYAMKWTGGGALIANTNRTIDASGLNCRHPRVANLNSADRHLIVYEKTDPQVASGRTQIAGRLLDAQVAANPYTEFLISNWLLGGGNYTPEIGGDEGTGPGNHLWLVTWNWSVASNASYVVVRTFRADGLPLNTPFTQLAGSPSSVYMSPKISQSNGNGVLPQAKWMVAYSYRYSATDWDVYGAVLDEDGNVTAPNFVIDATGNNDLYPAVSAPAGEPGAGLTKFMVTYERQSPFAAWAKVVWSNATTNVPSTNLSGAFGFGGFWAQAESDGQRFAVCTGASNISLATLAIVNGALVVQDNLQSLAGSPAFPALCSKRSGGGSLSEYGAVHVDTGLFPDTLVVSVYGGYQSGSIVSRRVMGCGGLGIGWTGRSLVGESLTFTLQNPGNDLPGLMLGFPAPASTFLCPTCPIGVNLQGPTANYLLASTVNWTIPANAGLVGISLAMQGYGLGSGPCVAALRFSDTIDFTIR